MATADGSDAGFLRKRNQASRARHSFAWLRRPGARHAVSRGLRVRQVRCARSANPRSEVFYLPAAAWQTRDQLPGAPGARYSTPPPPAQGIECFADREQLGRRNIRGRPCGGHLDKQARGHDIVGCLKEHGRRGDPARQCLPLQHGFQPPAPAL